MKIIEKLALLRAEMVTHGIDMYLVPSNDEHNNEYLPECHKRREWISNFTGSAGVVIVTLHHAYLWTDGRYFLQAEQELDHDHYTLIKQKGYISEINSWLELNAVNMKLGYDLKLITTHNSANLKNIMHSINGDAISIDVNLIDKIRMKHNEFPHVSINPPTNHAYYLDDKYTGCGVQDKLSWLRGELRIHKVDYIALNTLDEIAWLFNMRGSDISYNPLVISYAIVGLTNATLFVDINKLDKNLLDMLSIANIKILAYGEFGNILHTLKSKILLDEKTANEWMYRSLCNSNEIILGMSPIQHKKAIKNDIEIAGARLAHYSDAVAVIEFLAWLDKSWVDGVDEISAQDMLSHLRAKNINLRGDSFHTISGFGENSAVIHYRASENTNKKIDNTSLYLVDSGGQYLSGTTDITRVVHLGEPTDTQKHYYTLVLKAHLALSRVKFPHGTCGEHIDAIARQYLWDECIDYRHGTGHGVGSFLCVHEGPQRISQTYSKVPLLPGMIVSNEPGFYIENQYGIRIENLCLVTEIETPSTHEYGKFYGFETLTLVPYYKKLIDERMLTQTEKMQIIDYYNKIKDKVSPHLTKDAEDWFKMQY